MFVSRLVIATLCVALLVVLLRKKKAGHRRLPPGPLPMPILGNIREIDLRHPWKTYAKWGAEYGNLVYARLFTQDIIVINSEKIARDLLEDHSRNYSSRPDSIYAMSELLGTGFLTLFLAYGDRWRIHRRLFHQAFHQSVAPSFRPALLRKTHDLIKRLLSNPPNYSEQLQLLGASAILAIAYDYDASGLHDPMVTHVERAAGIAVKEMQPEVAAVVAALPILKYLPSWFPGAGFKRDIRIQRKFIAGWVDVPFEYVKKSMAAGIAAPSMVSDAVSRIQDEAHTDAEKAHLEIAVKEVAASAYAAGSESIHSTLMIFFLVMILYPDAQARAQAEIDAVIGEGLERLPQWEDRTSLPYIEAVLKETLRWCPTVPLSLPHATLNDDVYEGYYIPKGAIVVANAWAMSRDPVRFPEPEKFKPERFLVEKGQSADELSYAFGFGRRICAGRYVADATLWISIVTMLAVFRFDAPSSWNPGPDGANVKWSEGVTTHPVDVPVIIKPRHENLTQEKLSHLILQTGL